MAKVAVITPYKDAESFLPGFVSMLQAQTYSDWVCILVDDGSIDSGPALLAALALQDPRLIPLRRHGIKVGPGPAEARNLALNFADAPYIAFCDVDDLWHPEKLQRQLHFHECNNLQLSVTGYGRFKHGVSPAVCSWRCPPNSLTYARLLFGNELPMLTIIVDRDLLDSPFPVCRHEDYAYWLDMFRRHSLIRYGCLPYGLAFYRIHLGNLTARRWEMVFWVNRVYRDHGLPWAVRSALLVCWGLNRLRLGFREYLARFKVGDSMALLLERLPVLLRPV